MKIEELIQENTKRLNSSGSCSPRLDAELLIGGILNLTREKLYVHLKKEVGVEEQKRIQVFFARRRQGEPVAYILGHKYFFDNDFVVNSSVLIPRAETEVLVEAALDWLRRQKFSIPVRIMDLGTGSGCIGLSLLKAYPNSQLLAVDSSARALEVAQKNAKRLCGGKNIFFLNKRVEEIKVSDLPNSFYEKTDLIVANPPYIATNPKSGASFIENNVKKYEPEEALFSGKEGLKSIYQWSETTKDLLEERSAYMFEIGLSQAKSSIEFIKKLNIFNSIYKRQDYSQNDRVICCEK